MAKDFGGRYRGYGLKNWKGISLKKNKRKKWTKQFGISLRHNSGLIDGIQKSIENCFK